MIFNACHAFFACKYLWYIKSFRTKGLLLSGIGVSSILQRLSDHGHFHGSLLTLRTT